MHKILLAILSLIILILIVKNTEKFSNCDRTIWSDDSCNMGGVCKQPDGNGSKWTCYDADNNTVILFYTDWCSYSKNFMPIWEEISKKFINMQNSKIKFIRINCDPDTSKCNEGTNCSNGQQIYNDYKISQVPMVLFIPSNGEYPNGIRFNLSINGVDSEDEENKQSFDRFIQINLSNFPAAT